MRENGLCTAQFERIIQNAPVSIMAERRQEARARLAAARPQS